MVTLDLSKMLSPTNKHPVVNTDKPANPVNPTKLDDSVIGAEKQDTVATGDKKYYLHSIRPDFGCFITDTQRVKFKGSYLVTKDETVKDFVLKHYSRYVSEIPEELYIDAHTFKQD